MSRRNVAIRSKPRSGKSIVSRAGYLPSILMLMIAPFRSDCIWCLLPEVYGVHYSGRCTPVKSAGRMGLYEERLVWHMAKQIDAEARRRIPLSRDRVLGAAV